jgi:hypothetical protein
LAVVESDIRAIRDSLKEIRDEIVGTPPLTPTITPPSNPEFPDYDLINRNSFQTKPIRVPPPKFDGTKEGTKITTWFEQFDDYASLMHIATRDLVANASLCLSGRAAEQWALMKKSLAQRGKDPKDFSTFKTEMLSQFVEGKVEHTVRVRLSRLRHTNSVASYHAAFRAIMVEAVQHPISGPEACSAFRNGLKPAVYQLVMRDAMAKDEFEHLDVVVKAAKEAEDLLAVLAGASHNDHRREGGAPRQENKRRAPHLAGKPPKRPAQTLSPLELQAEKNKWVKKGLPEAVFYKRHSDGRCLNCGSLEHTTTACKEAGIVMPPPRGA